MSARVIERISRYDTADYLKSEDDIAAYLEAVMDDGDPALIAAAQEVGMSRVGLNKALSGQGNPRLSTILKVSKALGLKLSVQTATHTP